jgi:hypothetical protein
LKPLIKIAVDVAEQALAGVHHRQLVDVLMPNLARVQFHNFQIDTFFFFYKYSKISQISDLKNSFFAQSGYL